VEAAPQGACVTARFDVTVRNTSLAEEFVTLNSATGIPALNDTKSFGDITSTHGTAAGAGSVLGTTCGVGTSAAGLGTLSGSLGGGAFPQQLNAGSTPVSPPTTPPTSSDGGSYSCKFDGVVCGTPTAIPNVCAYGLTAQVAITPNLTGDDGAPNADTITVTATPLTADICLAVSGS
jgi:hypothetical protein